MTDLSDHSRKHKSVGSAIDALGSVYESAKADYNATKKGRFNRRRKNLPSMGGSADYHIRSEYEYYNLIEDCYDLERNDSVAGQLTNLRTANIVQDGFRLDPNTTDKSLDRDIKDRWNEFADDPEQCDVSGEATFHDFEFAAEWTSTLAGDCGISITDDGPLQFFEPYLIRRDQAGSDDTFLGVDQNEDRRREKYWIAEDSVDPHDTTLRNSAPIDVRDRFGRRQFMHIYNRKRTTLTRGVSAYAPIFELTGMLEDVNFAKLVQQQMVSCIAYLVEELAGTDESKVLPATKFGTNERTEQYPNGTNKLIPTVEPGMAVEPGAGRKVTGFSPNIPNPEYFQQYRLIIQLICGNLELPLSVGMMDGSETTFHGFIGAGNEGKKLWRLSQKRRIKRFHRPVYLGKLNHFTDEDRAMRRAIKRLKQKARQPIWHPPVWQSVKPLDDTQDRLMRLRNAIVSPSKMHAELNSDYEDHVTQTIQDNSLAVRSAKTEAIKINAEFKDNQPVHWQQIYPMPTPDGIQATNQMVTESEGKSPLELQQLGLARERAEKVGDSELSKKLGKEMADQI